jgi:hypothetical protein
VSALGSDGSDDATGIGAFVGAGDGRDITALLRLAPPGWRKLLADRGLLLPSAKSIESPTFDIVSRVSLEEVGAMTQAGRHRAQADWSEVAVEFVRWST